MTSSNPPDDNNNLSLDVEKIIPETPSQSDSRLENGSDSNKENEGERPTDGDNGGEPAASQDGGPIERTESQAAKLGKKKSLVIMLAISVSLDCLLACLDRELIMSIIGLIILGRVGYGEISSKALE